ncbi:MAG: hypothetical protein M1838_001877 [Thelocarpon superellum]|nr:MAG: hypothetical protein M1838_001877 [Thelocarpon superellum]
MCSYFAAALLAACALRPVTAADVAGKAFNRFFTIWLENQDFLNVTKNPEVKTLSDSGILLTSYYSVTHPSQPNYIASVGGDYFGLNNDGLVSIPANVSTVVDLFDTRGIEWREYLEDVPGPGFMGANSTTPQGQLAYVRKHNPLVSYDSISGNGSRLLNLVSFEDFENDLRKHSLPQWAHMSPNMNNDGHDTSLQFAANWSHSFLQPLLANPYFMNNTLVLLTFDESETYSKPNQIGSLLLGGAVPSKLRGTTDDTFYTHYSILATLENNWGLPNLGRFDVGANVFAMVANQTGFKNHGVDRSKVALNESYPGPLNSQKPGPYPPPNPFLTGAGGQGIVDTVPPAWRQPAGGKVDTVYDGSGNLFDGYDHLPVSQVLTSGAPTPTGDATPTSTVQTSGARRNRPFSFW